MYKETFTELHPPSFPSLARMGSHAHLRTNHWPRKWKYHDWLEIFRIHPPHSVGLGREPAFLKVYDHRMSEQKQNWVDE